MYENISLIGFMGSGKTTVGWRLAERLGWRLTDTDALIESAAGRSIPEIFAGEGEAAFREREAAAVREACRGFGQVIATGGGAALRAENVAALREASLIVWLTARPDVVVARTERAAPGRPLLAARNGDLLTHVLKMLGERGPIYQSAAHLIVDASDRTPDAIAAEIHRKWEKFRPLPPHPLPHRNGEGGGGEGPPQVVQSSRMAQRLTVPLSGGREYDIHIGAGQLTAEAGKIFAEVARSRRAVVITQPNIAGLWGEPLRAGLCAAGFDPPTVITFPDGERYKNFKAVTRLCDALYEIAPAIDRKTLIVALGGGVVGDVAGFVASLYLRGLDYIQVPTTLLAMVDSSVGGKTGVDFREGKNLVGAFHQPRAVCIDTATLTTLPVRERRAGMAEIIKYGVIREPEILAVLSDKEVTQDATAMLADLIYRSCAIKADVVAHDEYETTGLRAILNYGHTVGHALESATNYRRYKHGEAVAIGMMAAAAIGEIHGVTPPDVRSSIEKALQAQRLPTAFPADIEVDSVLPLMARDKKAEGGRARFVLARALGDIALYDDVAEATVREGIRRVTRG